MQPSITQFFKARQPNQTVDPVVRDTPEKTNENSSKRPAEDQIEDKRAIKRQATSSPITTPARQTKSVINSPAVSSPSVKPATPSAPSRPENDRTEYASSETVEHPHLHYKFLYPPHRRDIENRSPEDPDYDEKTLYVPRGFLDSQTPAMRQWWLIKQNNMDAILFFKMGKFYELFNEDAVIGVNNLDIIYMKGDETKPAHAGFPEISYEKYSKILVEKGFKVIRVEQTETPAMMEERCQTTGRKGKFDRVVNRVPCRITTRGTQMLGVMETVFHSSKNQYLMAVRESIDESSDSSRLPTFGICFIDVTVSRLYLGQFVDDHNLSKLNLMLAHYTPAELLYERGNLSQLAMQALLRTGADLRMLKPDKEFWPIKKALSYLKTHDIFQDEHGICEWPSVIKELFEDGDESESLLVVEPKMDYYLALTSFGAIVYYLQSQQIAQQVLKCTTYELYHSPLQGSQKNGQRESAPMILDHVVLRNLEIFENSAGGTSATLFESINYCKTHFGQRLLKNWLCSPLCNVNAINRRLDAVEAMISNQNASLITEICHLLDQLPDLERLLSKIKSQCFKSDGDSRAIMFDDNLYSKAKITSFLTLLTNFKRLQKFIISISKTIQKCESDTLKRLLSLTTEGGLYPDYSATLDYFEAAFDHEVARKTGKIIPAPGVDKEYDRCQENIRDVKDKLDEYLEEQKVVLKCRHIEYFGTAKNRYQLQVPESYCDKIPPEYRIETTRKGVKRYYTHTIDKLFQKLTVHEEELKKTLDGIMSKIFEQFSRKIKLWSAAIECVSIIDVLQSIANFVRSLKADNVDVCRPVFLEDQSKPIIEYRNGRHPSLVKIDPNYIDNDLTLDDKLILLSGANMGGKSTLMRQTGLLVILAQLGCFVPASSMKLTPVDRMFSRLGASDRLLEGESTFYTELVETSAMLGSATEASLLLLDELGRGTSTYDGTAIAYSVIQEISSKLKCRCLFSTHYHTLVQDFKDARNVRLAHMSCKVEKETGNAIDLDPLKENITFLYKIAEGPVGRSYGFNVAKLAGIDDEIIACAFKKAKEIELKSKALETVQKLCSRGNNVMKRSELRDQVVSIMVKG